jgi:PBP1b-binding outer membrane lipoprotein LpoB
MNTKLCSFGILVLLIFLTGCTEITTEVETNEIIEESENTFDSYNNEELSSIVDSSLNSYLQVINSEDCTSNWYSCDDFVKQEDAQYIWEYCGPNDIHNLDGDDDGQACENLL